MGQNMRTFKGQKASSGIAIGPMLYFRRRRADTSFNPICDVQAELDLVERAIREAVSQLDMIRSIALKKLGDEDANLFEVHSMMLTDPDYRASITHFIVEEKANAEYAVSKTADVFAQMFLDMEDERMKVLATDVWDVSARVLDILHGSASFMVCLQKPVIIAADELYPSETVQLDTSLVLALVTSNGSSNSHTAIFARNMGIPAVCALGKTIDESCNGKEAIVDGDGATLYIEPDRKTAEGWFKRRDEEAQKKAALATLVGLPGETLDGKKIKLLANIAGPADVDAALANDAEGIGLVRSEFIFMGLTGFPSEEQQYVSYRKIVDKAKGRDVVIRTLDVGADKQIDYFKLPKEENPALGLRALRVCLDRPEIFVTQLRAIYRAAAHGNVSILLPMVSSLWELREAKEIAAKVRSGLEAERVPYSPRVPIGVMIETPAAALISDDLAREADFFSIGTNDLIQYTLVVDRQNSALNRFTDTHHPAVLKLLKLTAENARRAGIPIGICGELASDTELTKTFIQIGIDSLSVSPPMILPLRKLIREMNAGG